MSDVRLVSRATAEAVYTFQLPTLIARLFLYLFGEFDKDTVDAIHRALKEEGKILQNILDKKAPPLRLLYDELILKGLIEIQPLSADTELYLDLPDDLQLRIAPKEALDE